MANGKLYHRGEVDYASLDAVNISTLKGLRRSPKHYRYWLKHRKPPTRSMDLGNAAHIAVLEPERFLREFALWDEKTESGKTRPRRGKDWDAFCAKHDGKQIIRVDEYDEAIRFRDAIRSDRLAMKYLAMGRPEVSMRWTCEYSGLECKGRVDWLTEVDDHPCLVDVKTTAQIELYNFAKQAARLDYHLQCSFYADGYERVTGKAPRVAVVVVETAPPYDVVVYIMPPDVLEIGRDQYRMLLDELKQCRESDEWPGVGGGREQYFQLPRWAVPDDEDADDLGLTGWKEAG